MTTFVDISQDINELKPGIIALRRELHQHPELAFEEVWTATTLAGRMRALGLAVQEGIGGTGVLAVLEGAKPGKTLLIRADIDALPIVETTGRAYASQLENRNHSCGHDAHAAIVAGVAEVLVRHRDRIAGRIAFVFQPADEPMRGACRMIEDGLLERVRPDMSLSVHVLPMANVGQAVIQSGPLWASWDTLILKISGPAPSLDVPTTGDITRAAAQVVTALYDLVEREGHSTEPVTLRVRSLTAEQGDHGAPSQAAIEVHMGRGAPGQATIEVNLALYDNALRARLLSRIEDVAGAIVSAAGGTLSAEVDYALPALVNDEQVTGTLERVARRVIGRANIIKHWRNRFSDDFGLFMAAAPGCLMLLGTANPDKGITKIWHRPGFDIDEDALAVGVEIMSLAALDLLQ
jgi:amidohydrolase